MEIINGIAYAGTADAEKRVIAVKPLGDGMLLVTFAPGEKRLYDVTPLLSFPAFQPLRDEAVFKAVQVDHGVVTWMDGEIDIAPETMYADSFAYNEIAM